MFFHAKVGALVRCGMGCVKVTQIAPLEVQVQVLVWEHAKLNKTQNGQDDPHFSIHSTEYGRGANELQQDVLGDLILVVILGAARAHPAVDPQLDFLHYPFELAFVAFGDTHFSGHVNIPTLMNWE